MNDKSFDNGVDTQAENDDIIITIRLLVKGNKVGTIIGKGGDRITAMRKESGCTIKIQGCDQDVEQIVSISGSLSGVVKAMHTVAVYNEESNNKDTTNSRASKFPATIHIVVPAIQCGAIIGTGGFRIKEIREQTGCMVKIGREHLPRSTEKLITLSGTPEVIRVTIEKICQVMISESTPNNTRCIPYTPATFGPSPVFGGDQQPFQSLGYGYGTAQSGPPAVQQGSYGGGQYGGYGHGAPAHAITAPPTQEPQQMMGPLGPINPVELLANTDTSFFKNKIQNTKLQDGQTEFHIPKEMMGSVIGQRGSIIKEIRALTTPDIKIHEQEEGVTFRKLHIAGGPDVIERVNLLLHICVNVYHESRDKIGNMNMLQAVQYGQAMKHKQEPEVHANYTMPFQKAPQGMPFTAENPGYSGQFGGHPPAHNGYGGGAKKRPFHEPNSSSSVPYGVETPPQQKREKFLQFQ